MTVPEAPHRSTRGQIWLNQQLFALEVIHAQVSIIPTRNETSPGNWACSMAKLPGGRYRVGKDGGSSPNFVSAILEIHSCLNDMKTQRVQF